jgi:hypothetical protein
LRSLAQEIRAKDDCEMTGPNSPRSAGKRNVAVSRSSPSASGKVGGRINWRAVLEKLPKEFKASHIRAVPSEAVRPEARPLADEQAQALEALVTRRRQLVEMLTAEKNRRARDSKGFTP